MTGKRAAPKQNRRFPWSRTDSTPEVSPADEALDLPAPTLADQVPTQFAHPLDQALTDTPAPPKQRGAVKAADLVHAGPASRAVPPIGPALPLEPPPIATPSGADVLVPAGNPSVLPSGAVPLGSRGMARQEARRKGKRALIALAGVFAVLLVVLAIQLHGNGGHSTPPPAPAAAGPNRVIFLQVTDASGASADALLGDQHGAAGAVVLVPPKLAVDVAGFGGETIQAGALHPGAGTTDGVADALGIQIDGTWTLSVGGLAALVDHVGGVDADVDVDVKQGDVITVPAGQQHLGGVAAAAYATYAAPGEPAQSQLARLDTVLEAIIGGLPSSVADATAVVAGLGASSQSTLPVADLGAVLAHLHELDTSNTVVYRSLPVHDSDAGVDAAYTVDTAGASQAIQDLTGSPTGQLSADSIRVMIRNGVGTPGLGETARAKLDKAGDVYISGGNQVPFDNDETVVLISEDTPDQRAMGLKVATALGVPASSLRVTGEGQSIADIIAVLGTDYHP